MSRKVREAQINIKNSSKATYNSLMPLTWLLTLFAINDNGENAAYSKPFHIFKCFLALTFFGSLDLFSLYYKNVHIYKYTKIISSIKLTDTVQALYDFGQYVVDLWFVYKYGRYISMDYFRQYECIDEILEMNHYSKIKWKLMRLIGFFTFVWLATSACDFAAWSLNFGWLVPSVYAVAYIFLYIKILTTLDLSSHVMHIEFRLMIIGDIVQHYYSVKESLPEFKGKLISGKNCLYANTTESKPRAATLKLECDECAECRLLTRCYLQLTEQVEFINDMFGFRILLNSLSLLIDIIRFTNIAVRIVLGTQVVHHESRYFPAVSSMMRQLTCVLVLISLVNRCEKVYLQSDRILKAIDHLLINKKISDSFRLALTELRGLMQARPINFNLARFFRLDNGLLVSIASVVVTYTIILLQTMN